MDFLTETGTLPADALMVDDWIVIGGHTFRICAIERDSMNVTLKLYDTGDIVSFAELTVSKIQPIKFYNQKV